MTLDNIFDRLWHEYSVQNPSAGKIRDLFLKSENGLINDHIAFRTLNDPRITINTLARVFTDRGYKESGKYTFKKKKLKAHHYELPGVEDAPRIFISELILDEISEFARKTLLTSLEAANQEIFQDDELIFSGNVTGLPSYKAYQQLRKESEYAAWFYAHGFRANHFTISVNSLKTYTGIEDVNIFLKKQGFTLNSSGGEIKGSKQQLLKQSSTQADIVEVPFTVGNMDIPACYYEFAERFHDSSGNLFNGFIAGSADKIFESTNFNKGEG